jgi:hypothetical protein
MGFRWIGDRVERRAAFLVARGTEQGTCLFEEVAVSRTERCEAHGPLLGRGRSHFVENSFQAVPAFQGGFF